MIKILSLLAALLLIPVSIAFASAPVPMRVQVVDERGIPVRDAVVEVEPNAVHSGGIRFPWRMAMAQKDEQFVPGTLVVARGSRVAFPNLDRVRHSIYSFSKPARFEIDLYGRDQTRSHGFAISGTVALGCKIHDQMRGYIRVVDTPFAGKTDANGFLALSDVPSGNATITVWHPRLRAPGGELKSTVGISGSKNFQKITVRLR